MSDGYVQHPRYRGELRCQFERTLKGEYCGEKGEVRLDGLAVCRRHADRLRLEERMAYWRAILAFLELWSGEACRRNRSDVVGLLEIERAKSSVALGSVLEDLQKLEELQESQDGVDGELSGDSEDGSGDGKASPP